MTEYRLNPDGDYAPRRMAVGEVIPVNHVEGEPRLAFLCPCGKRPVIVLRHKHKASFDLQGRLSLRKSVGSRGWVHTVNGKSLTGMPLNWCHFMISKGRAVMCDDAQCFGTEK